MRVVMSALLLAALTLSGFGCVQAADTVSISPAAEPLVADAPPRALVIGGRPAATIIVRDRPTAELRFAVDTLQEYIRRMSGATLPIATDSAAVTGNRVLLGLPDACREAGLSVPRGIDEDGYLLCTQGADIGIVGASDRGTVNGVIGLLDDHLGVRWYVPGDDLGTVVPHATDIVLPELNETRAPSFAMRWVGEGTDWAVLNRQSCSGESLPASFRIEPGIYHTQAALLPYAQYFPEHPEYFAFGGRIRSKDPACKPCYANHEGAAAIAGNLGRLLDADPQINLLSFSPTDGQLWCGCDECRALDEADVPRDQRMSRRSLHYYNAIAAALRRTHPQAHMLVGAYNVYTWPPRDRSVTADPMLSVVVTHYDDYCLAHPMSDPTCPRNQRWVELLDAWDRLGTRLCYYEYYWKTSWLDAPWPIVHSIARDIPWLHGRGDIGLYTQFRTSNAWTLYPNYWIAARLLWDHTADADALFDQMCADLYGPAGPAVREYYRVMEDAMAGCDEHFAGTFMRFGRLVFTDSVLAQMGRRLEEARVATEDPTIRARLAKLELSYDYTKRLVAFTDLRLSNDPREQREALALVEALVTEVRGDRAKWNGIVSSNVVAEGRWLGQELTRMREQVGGGARN